MPKLNQIVDWEAFRPILVNIRQKAVKGAGERPAYDVILILTIMVLQHLYNLADEQTEYQILDRSSHCRLLNISPEGKVPDAWTIRVFREALKSHDLLDELFARWMSRPK